VAIEGDHRRSEARTPTVLLDVVWRPDRYCRPGPKGVFIVESQTEIDGKITKETRVYITS